MKRNLLKRIFVDTITPLAMALSLEITLANAVGFHANKTVLQAYEKCYGVDLTLEYAHRRLYEDRHEKKWLRPFVGALGARKAFNEYVS